MGELLWETHPGELDTEAGAMVVEGHLWGQIHLCGLISPSLAAWPRASHLTSLCLSFFIHIMGTRAIVLCVGGVRNK